ncbi:hypothetical protein [Paenibacillus glucanolyticus]|uniref:hypothetical protein n=1 Tax=Paenibacillus glucanolyticus TaxID=59843 RepID=UPI00096FDABB|nr:hypothetical protein [Paenibacillus glucanolyticus]OMF76796.1 hypothetical protein BK142_14860 [Paenibacillus glucanolyticus]
MEGLIKFCESKGVTELRYIGEDKARIYYAGYCKAINKEVKVQHAKTHLYGTVWFDGVISGYVNKKNPCGL